MKMQKYYPVIKSRADHWMACPSNRLKWKKHVKDVIKSDEYKVLHVRLAWDFAQIITSAEERTKMINDCDANDKCFTTLMVNVCKDVKAI